MLTKHLFQTEPDTALSTKCKSVFLTYIQNICSG